MVKNNNMSELESLIKSGAFENNELYQLKVLWVIALIVVWLFFVVCWAVGTFSSTAYLWVGDYSQVLGLLTSPKVAGLNFIGFVIVGALGALTRFGHLLLRR
ncbi:hypothetical protein [Vibrio crassostreae]|uniref:hypothetical protein n=1 Tax=Vibrio crassostreae TaxID=246167 RepID=UPI001B303D4A|nr:hypothetical protein [Vibrio crassostreae]